MPIPHGDHARSRGWGRGPTEPGDVHTIALTGELDLETARAVQEELERIEREDALRIVVDMWS